LDALPDTGNHLHRIDVTHRILAEEVQFDLAVLEVLDVFDPEGAASLGVGLVLALLVADPQRQLIDEVGGSAQLLIFHIPIFYLSQIVLPDLVDAPLESPRLLVLLAVVLSLEARVGRQEDVLVG
jgi:hypothetical protein